MRIMMSMLVLAAVITAACAAPQRETLAQGAQTARAQFVDSTGRRTGQATLRQGPHGVHVDVRLEDAPEGTRAIHVHEVGRCQPDFAAAGAHWNPEGREHGFLNTSGPHAGDMPNLRVGNDGSAQAEFFLRGVRLSGEGRGLLDDNGSALVVHERADDHRTDPSGGSGNRVLCAVIER